ncbi:putative bifunctional diguanylate cyclase/phosphodiesterase [Paramagnetospirillum kuznetsovii]|nr:bifunctional diguanylate cyclase/phosphodiesterase [Paramagnetospirillum kuznetsovii]
MEQSIMFASPESTNERMQAILDNCPIGLVILTSAGTVTMINDAAARILRIGENIAGRAAVTMPGSIDLLLDAYVRAYPIILAGETFEDEILIRRLDGSEFWCRLSIRLVSGLNGSGETLWVIDDVSETHSSKEKLLASEERYRGMVESQSEFVIRLDLGGHFLFANEAFTRALRLEPEEILCTVWQSYVHADDRTATGAALATAGRSPAYRATIENRMTFPDGDRWVAWEGGGINNADGKVVEIQAVGRDINEQKLSEERVRYLAYHDALTGLPNQSLVEDRARMAMAFADRANSKCALLFLDLDHFKIINDSIGNQVADHLLKRVGERLEQSVRDTDTVGRHSGDEFLILLADIHSSEAAGGVADKIIHALADPFDVNGHIVSTSASIGIALYPEDGSDFETLRRRSDSAMYEAKEMGRNAYCLFDPGMLADVDEQLRLRHDLRLGLERSEFVLHYQPQVDLTHGKTIGMEALIRWNHPGLGMIPPGRFIPIAEKSGLIVPMGDWVIREACGQIAAWQRDGLPKMVVAVNLSALQFQRGNIEETVTRALADAGVDPAWLELELTESILIKDAESVLTTLKRLKSLGLSLSIDDFGTGYSSLAYLKRFKVDKLKIDQSFVRDLMVDDDDASIVRTIIQMAGNLDLKTIAEGVEDKHTLHHLKTMNCDEVQGYYFARPMPADEAATFADSYYWDHAAERDAGRHGQAECLEQICNA